MSALQVRASRVRFNLTLIPDRFSPQKLTQVEQLNLWRSISGTYYAATCSDRAPARAVSAARGVLRRNHAALPCGRLWHDRQSRRNHNQPVRRHAGVYDSTVRRCGNLGTPLARSSDLLFPVVRLRESKCAVLLSHSEAFKYSAHRSGDESSAPYARYFLDNTGRSVKQ